jgi:hypothetical protein
MKSYRFFGEEAEALGSRLDAARAALAEAKSAWPKNYWAGVVERLLFQWRQLPVLHDADAKVTIIPRWTIDYNYYELGEVHEHYGITEKIYDRFLKHDANLDASWNNHRAARLARAQF